MNFDMPAQRLIINSVKLQIKSWQEMCSSSTLSEDDAADIQNDIGYAYTVLSELEESFLKQFGSYPE